MMCILTYIDLSSKSREMAFLQSNICQFFKIFVKKFEKITLENSRNAHIFLVIGSYPDRLLYFKYMYQQTKIPILD